MIPDPLLDTASQRLPTGMDYGARALILGALQMAHSVIFQAFLAERFLSVDDYLLAVEPVWGQEQAETIRTEIQRAANSVPSVTSFGEQAQAENLFALTILAHIPESDFDQQCSWLASGRPSLRPMPSTGFARTGASSGSSRQARGSPGSATRRSSSERSGQP